MASKASRALRASSDALLRDAERLTALEREKRLMAGGDPRRAEVSREIEAIARRVVGEASTETMLTGHLAESEGSEAPPIAATPREIAAILDEWRAAERDAADAPPDSAERQSAEARIAQLVNEYRSALRDQQ